MAELPDNGLADRLLVARNAQAFANDLTRDGFLSSEWMLIEFARRLAA